MIECSLMLPHAARKPFSLIGRRARISYRPARSGSWWFCEGSEISMVQRRRITVFGGSGNENVVGIGLTNCEGNDELIVWLRAMVS